MHAKHGIKMLHPIAVYVKKSCLRVRHEQSARHPWHKKWYVREKCQAFSLDGFIESTFKSRLLTRRRRRRWMMILSNPLNERFHIFHSGFPEQVMCASLVQIFIEKQAHASRTRSSW
jgi:hypothetical protein